MHWLDYKRLRIGDIVKSYLIQSAVHISTLYFENSCLVFDGEAVVLGHIRLPCVGLDKRLQSDGLLLWALKTFRTSIYICLSVPARKKSSRTC